MSLSSWGECAFFEDGASHARPAESESDRFSPQAKLLEWGKVSAGAFPTQANSTLKGLMSR